MLLEVEKSRMISDILLLKLLGKLRLQDLEGVDLRALTLHIFL